MVLDKNQIGMDSMRKNKTSRAKTVNPEVKETVSKSNPSDSLFDKENKKVELSKSIRISEKTHSIISTISTIEDKKIYEALDNVIDKYVQDMPSASRKLIKDSLKAKGLQ